MAIRLLAGVLWFVAVSTACAIATYYLGMPRDVGPALAVAAGVLVAADPRGWIWPRRTVVEPTRPAGAVDTRQRAGDRGAS